VKSFKNNRGWLRILEIALAATLVFSFMIFINNFEGSSRSSRPETDEYLLRQLGEDSLRSYDLVDADNDAVTDLRFEVLTGDWEDIGEHLNNTLESSIGYSLYFYTKDSTVFKTGWTAVPINRDITTVYYIIAGDEAKHCSSGSACALKLDLWYIK